MQKMFAITDENEKFISPDAIRKMAEHNTLVLKTLNMSPTAISKAPVKTFTTRPLKKSDLWPAPKK